MKSDLSHEILFQLINSLNLHLRLISHSFATKYPEDKDLFDLLNNFEKEWSDLVKKQREYMLMAEQNESTDTSFQGDS